MTQIDIKLSAIYRAAHDELPAKATEFASQADGITGAIEPVTANVGLAGNHAIGGDLAELAVGLFVHLREMVRTFNDSAEALDRIADDFVATDDQAAQWMQNHQQYLGDPDLATEPVAPEV